MDHAVRARTPAHLWIVGVVSLLWNSFGAFDYVMSQTENEAYLAQFTDEQLAYFAGFPAWTDAFWALGVWGAVLGSLLLLLRSRHSVIAFAVSLVGLFGSTIYMFGMTTPPPSMMTTGIIAMNVAIWAIAIGLLIYARTLTARGLLR